MRRYFYDTLASYLSLYIRPEDQVIEIEPRRRQHFIVRADEKLTTFVELESVIRRNGELS